MHLLLLLVCLAVGVLADPNMQELEGTWLSKSNTVFTGPGFYDPVNELLIEPDLPGISYSFTADGHYEEALYRVLSNPVNHGCPTAVLIYQHGSYELLANGSLVLKPIAVDGRQLLSDPCNLGNKSIYSRYVQPTLFKKFQVMVSPYHGRYMIQIYQFDESMMQPLYLAYRPPLMLPVTALNPTDAASETLQVLHKRSFSRKLDLLRSIGRDVRFKLENDLRTNAVRHSAAHVYDIMWWASVVCLALGSAVVVVKK